MWDNSALSSLPVPHLSFSWATVMVLGKRLRSYIAVNFCWVAARLHAGICSGGRLPIGATAQYWSLVTEARVSPKPPTFTSQALLLPSAVKAHPRAPPHVQSLNTLWKRSDVNSFCQEPVLPSTAATLLLHEKRLKHAWAAKQERGPCPCSLELPRHWTEAVAGTETGKVWRLLSLFGAVPSWICHLITV